ncbi:MaoC family dehydratase [Saccharopolyspora sp. NPDC000359]|uniref:MaoC family dehydratase n=1 Tax=Saccharopolyspora sp. NPDC000359 TaxID=3154251 RepID=UPI00332430BC
MSLPPTRAFEQVRVGDRVPELAIPLTRTLIVATAIASRDFQDVHHDPELAVERGSPDVFMNILTTNGLLDRFATSWAGPASVVRAIRIRLGAPNHPGDTLVLTGEVTGKDVEDRSVSLAVTGTNSRGAHVTGTVVLHLPGAEEESA